MEGYTEFHCK